MVINSCNFEPTNELVHFIFGTFVRVWRCGEGGCVGASLVLLPDDE